MFACSFQTSGKLFSCQPRFHVVDARVVANRNGFIGVTSKRRPEGGRLYVEDWTGLEWNGLVKRGLVKGGLVKRGLVKRGLVNHGLIKRGLVKPASQTA